MDDKTIDQQSYDEVADRIANFDFARAAELMSVMEKVPAVGIKNTAIFGLAQAELEAMNTEAKEIAQARKDAAEKELARRQARAQDERDEVEEPQQQTGGTPNEPEKIDTTPGQPAPRIQRRT